MHKTSDPEAALTWAELPAVITAYLSAHEARDTETAVRAFAVDAVVTDEGHTYRGREEIRAWLTNSGSRYTYSTDFVGAHRIGAAQFDVLQHLEGNFPGGSADLHYRFTLAGTSIIRLTIEP
ncbi:nuclear transport factor 2 family protein [Micromonospora sp. NPDC048871]|uniref:nuclear transport factor 2 family protein n=1 Tax=Micromonospora sp. NPDC048871 TaxID=3364259 RepID=UPI00372140CA